MEYNLTNENITEHRELGYKWGKKIINVEILGIYSLLRGWSLTHVYVGIRSLKC